MTRSELLEVVYRFYPPGLHTSAPGYGDTDQRQRQRDAARRGAAEYPTWRAMLRRLSARYELASDDSLCVPAEWYTPACSASIAIPGRKLGFHVSLLGPYYGIHRTGLPVEELPALDLAREIEATYPGYEPIPPELGDELVPDVCVDHRQLGQATIYDCVLSPEWRSSSEPWPPPPPEPPPPRVRHSAAERREMRAGVERRIQQAGRFVCREGDNLSDVLAAIEHEDPEEPEEPLDDDPDREAEEPPADGLRNTERRGPGGQ
jgi:hypothetical protein